MQNALQNWYDEFGVPVNFFYDEPEHMIYLHGFKTGHKSTHIQHMSEKSIHEK